MNAEILPKPAITSAPVGRLYELDGLRVTVFVLLILYHTGMLYVAGWDFHYKSQYQSEFLANLMLWSNQWRMSLLFFISGAALALFLPGDALCKKVGIRLGHLLVPLLFGMLVVVVPQVYLEAKSKNIITGLDYWQFWFAYLDQHSAEFEGHKTLGAMHLTWNHLWYLPYLLAYTAILAAIYPLLRSQWMQSIGFRLSGRTTLTHMVLLPIFAFYINGALLYENNPVTHNLVTDWFNHGRSFISFIFGFTMVQIPALWNRIKTLRWHLLIAGLLSYAYILFAYHGGKLGDGIVSQELNGLLWSANSWLWMLCVIAWGQHWFTHPTPLIHYLNSGTFCFYILHQTLIIIFAYWLTPLQTGGFFEPLLVILLTMLSCWILFELIKPIPGLRTLMGINMHTKATNERKTGTFTRAQ